MSEEILCNVCENPGEHFYKIRGDVYCEDCMDDLMAQATEAMDD